MSAFLKLHFVGKWILLSISSQPPKIRVKPGHTYKSIQFDSSHREGEIEFFFFFFFRLISFQVWLVDVIALFLVMWPLSWYQFCVSLPLEVRTVGLVLFLQVLTLLSVLHCLPPAGHVEPVFSDSVFSADVRRNNRELHNTEKKVLFATCAAPVPRYSRHDLLSLETAAAPPSFLSPQLIARLSHLGIARNVPRKPRRSRRGGKNERRKIKVIVGFRDRLSSDSSTSPTPCQHTTSLTTFLSTQWPWRPLSLLAQRSAASPSQTAASHSP